RPSPVTKLSASAECGTPDGHQAARGPHPEFASIVVGHDARPVMLVPWAVAPRRRAARVFCSKCQSIIEDSARFCPMCGVALFGRAARIARGAVLRIGDDAGVRVEEPLGEGGMGV